MTRRHRRFGVHIWVLLLLPIGLWIGAAGGKDLSWGVQRLAQLQRLDHGAARVIGAVIRVEPLPWGRLTLGRYGQRRERIRYRFQTSEGGTLEGADTLTLLGIKTFGAGQKIEIAYLRSDPSANLILERNGRSDTTVITAFGAVGVVAGIFFAGLSIFLVYAYAAWRV